jgi:hypothetical protein
VSTETVVSTYLDLLDRQRETAFAALEGLTDDQLWKRPKPKERSVGEILNHTYLLLASTMPYVRLAWRCLRWFAVLRRSRPCRTDLPDLYRDGKFPMWVGFLWTPRYSSGKPVPLDQLETELRDLHAEARAFYSGKDESLLGHVYLFDPYFGFLSLLLALRLGAYHDQLHYDDVVELARAYEE